MDIYKYLEIDYEGPGMRHIPPEHKDFILAACVLLPHTEKEDYMAPANKGDITKGQYRVVEVWTTEEYGRDLLYDNDREVNENPNTEYWKVDPELFNKLMQEKQHG